MEQNSGKIGVVMVMTQSTQEQILLDAGIFVPRINSEKVTSTCKYVVAVQNNPSNDEDDSLFAHKTAFLIGTISGVSASNANGEKLIKFDSYAEIHKPNAWQNGNIRLGVAYYDSPTDAKFRMGNYEFKPVKFATTSRQTLTEAKELFAKSNEMDFVNDAPTRVAGASHITGAVSNLVKTSQMNLTEAKAIIANGLGISPDQVEIIIKI